MPSLRQFPAQFSSFVGREVELAELAKAVTNSRLLTLTGTGGCGKTRLALETATRSLSAFPDDAWFVDLASIADPLLVPAVITSALEIPEESGSSAQERLISALAGKRALLIVDNCEHVRDACGVLVSSLLQSSPELTILATSRERLRIAGEVEWTVPPMAVPERSDTRDVEALFEYDGVRLFVDRASLAVRGFALVPENAEAVVRVVARLDGIPLAIELAAAWVRALAPGQIAERLDDRFRLLTRGWSHAPRRHRTLRATVDWSYELLSEARRRLFARLAVFSGGFELEAAEGVCGGDGIEDVLEGIYDLVEANFVVGEGAKDRVRYRLLETLREYALERLDAGGEHDALRGRHLAYFASEAERAEPVVAAQDHERLDLLETDVANFRSALGWSLDGGDSVEGLRLAAALGPFCERRGHMVEGRSWLERTLGRATDAGAELRSKALGAAGTMAIQLGDHRAARPYFEEALIIRRDRADEAGAGVALMNLGNVAYTDGDLGAARPLYEESLAICRRLGDAASAARVLCNLGLLVADDGDDAQARTLLEEALEIRRQLGATDDVAPVLNNLGVLARQRDDYAEAAARFEEALALFRSASDEWRAADCLRNLGVIARLEDDLPRARTLYGKALESYRRLGYERGIPELLGTMGWMARLAGEPDAAADANTEALRLYMDQDRPAGIAAILDEEAAAAAERGDGIRAARLFGAAEVIREARGVRRSDADDATYAAIEAAARTATGHERFARAWSEGRVMSPDEAVEGARLRPAAETVVFTREGEYWNLAYSGRNVRVKDSKGVRYLAHLVGRSGQEVHALEVAGLTETRPAHLGTAEAHDAGLHVGSGDAGEMLDPQAVQEFRRRLVELEEELEEAESFTDPERAARARTEIDSLVGELKRAVGLGGRVRRSGSESERARINVTRAIRASITRITRQDRELGRHLDGAVRTGTLCAYAPGSPARPTR